MPGVNDRNCGQTRYGRIVTGDFEFPTLEVNTENLQQCPTTTYADSGFLSINGAPIIEIDCQVPISSEIRSGTEELADRFRRSLEGRFSVGYDVGSSVRCERNYSFVSLPHSCLESGHVPVKGSRKKKVVLCKECDAVIDGEDFAKNLVADLAVNKQNKKVATELRKMDQAVRAIFRGIP